MSPLHGWRLQDFKLLKNLLTVMLSERRRERIQIQGFIPMGLNATLCCPIKCNSRWLWGRFLLEFNVFVWFFIWDRLLNTLSFGFHDTVAHVDNLDIFSIYYFFKFPFEHWKFMLVFVLTDIVCMFPFSALGLIWILGETDNLLWI